nr:phage Gp37/Gp68 family protein [Confluentibacter sediminis]
MSKSSIEWTGSVWNPVVGCDKVSKGCKFCYAEVMAKRLKAMGNVRYPNGFQLTMHWDKIDEPRKWKKGKVIFVNSMSDLFHEDVPLEFIQKVFKTMNETPQHIYQILTKRSKRLADISHLLTWSDNIWMGVSVEDYLVMPRIDDLKKCGAQTKFISAEPLLGPLHNMDLSEIDWVIAGGESGFKARPIEKEWVLDIKEQCKTYDVAFFFKQWGGKNKKKAGNLLDGKKYEAYPIDKRFTKKSA